MSDESTSRTLKLGGAAAHALASEIRVTIVDGPDRGRAPFTSKGPSVVVGRAEAADLALTDPAISQFHVELTSTSAGIEVRDAGSSNGTFSADGVRLLAAIVPPGSNIVLGTTVLCVERTSDAAPAAEQLASFGRMRGASASMRTLFAVLARLASTELSVLIEGPTGSGKELLAEGLHQTSGFASGPFVVLDGTSIPQTLAESVLFGHERGAFTGANEARAGIFEAADGGTLFIDEVGEIPIDLQPKLLRVLERREVTRVGGSQARPIKVRVLTATWRDLRKMVNQGTFREDLYFRLAQARVAIPPLASRPEDVAPLVYHFLQSLPREAPGARMIAREALDVLKNRPWPGNVRELRSAVERAAMLARGETITLPDLAFERLLTGERERAEAPGATVKNAFAEELPVFKEAKRGLVDEFEKDYLSSLLAKCGDNLSRASAVSGIERHHLRDLLRKHGLRGS